MPKPWENAEGYHDPTAYHGTKNIIRDEDEQQKRVNTLIFVLKYITRLAGFELLNRIEIKDREGIQMINYYDPNFQGVHVIRVTFMQWDYIGHVAFEVGGNCKGAELMDFTFLECDNQEDIDRYSENDCQFSYDEENEVYTAVLKNADGDTLEVEGDECDFKAMAVAIEIAGTTVERR